MPAFASKKQYRMMMAILHGKAGRTARGDSGPPKSVADKYDGDGDDLPDSKGKEHHGGHWDGDKPAGGKKKKEVKKSSGAGVGVVVVNDKGQVLMGRETKDGSWAIPGGGIESGEGFIAAALRELKEETGLQLKADDISPLETQDSNKSFVARLKETPKVHSTNELSDVGFYDLDNVDLSKLRSCCMPSIKAYMSSKLNKGRRSLKDLMLVEKLEKNILRTGQVASAVYEMTHGDALKLVGNGTFRMLKDKLTGMEDDGIRDIRFGHYTLHIRKHANDIYSGRVDDGLKTVHQFVNRSIPALTGELMSVFEWYLPEDAPDFKHDDSMSDEIIHEGVGKLADNYRSYNLADIYDEMESIREEIRHGNAVDLQQAEQRIMGVFDSLEDKVLDEDRKIDEELEAIQAKLVHLQSKLDEMSKKPSKIEAFSSGPANPGKVFNEFYSYLSKPKVVVHPSGHIVIDFGSDWSNGDQSNFLKDLKAKALSKSRS